METFFKDTSFFSPGEGKACGLGIQEVTIIFGNRTDLHEIAFVTSATVTSLTHEFNDER